MTCKVVTASSWNLNYLQPHDFSMFAAAVARIGTVGFIFERILSGYFLHFWHILSSMPQQMLHADYHKYSWFPSMILSVQKFQRHFMAFLFSKKTFSISRRHFERMNSPFPNTRRPVYNFNYAKTKLVILNIHDILWHFWTVGQS